MIAVKTQIFYKKPDPFKPIECPICHKMFVKAPQHIYKLTLKDKNKDFFVCTYGCMCRGRKNRRKWK